MTRIACVGITVQDRIYSLNNLPDGGGKYQSNQYFETGGGPAATAAVAIARLGIDVDFIGRVGDDVVGIPCLTSFRAGGSIRRSAGNTRTPVHPSPQFWSTSMANALS